MFKTAREKVSKTPSQQTRKHRGLACGTSYSGGRSKRIGVQSKHGQKCETISEKQTKNKRTGM
jgi:hypothetical protein